MPFKPPTYKRKHRVYPRHQDPVSQWLRSKGFELTDARRGVWERDDLPDDADPDAKDLFLGLLSRLVAYTGVAKDWASGTPTVTLDIHSMSKGSNPPI